MKIHRLRIRLLPTWIILMEYLVVHFLINASVHLIASHVYVPSQPNCIRFILLIFHHHRYLFITSHFVERKNFDRYFKKIWLINRNQLNMHPFVDLTISHFFEIRTTIALAEVICAATISGWRAARPTFIIRIAYGNQAIFQFQSRLTSTSRLSYIACNRD